MFRYALLIGAPLAGHRQELRGVPNDIDAVARLLAAHDFDCRRCTGPAATRSGILDQMEHLIAGAGQDDAIVVYYSGHGGMVINTQHIQDLATPGYNPGYHRFLVPEDFVHSGDADFRGILDIELAYLIARLTTHTRNVTVVLDCCYSGGLARRGRVVRALDERAFRDKERRYNPLIAQRLADLDQRVGRAGQAWPTLDPDANPHLVRLEAARADQVAYEDDIGIGGMRHGQLTAAWVEADEWYRGRPVTWDVIYEQVCARVSTYRFGPQWPSIGGPRHRLLFQLEESALPGAIGVVRKGESFYVHGGTLLGIQGGDRFRLVPVVAGDYSDLGCATAVEVGPEWTRVELAGSEAGSTVLDGARAIPWRRGGPGCGVDVRAHGATHAAVLRLLEGTGMLPCPDDSVCLARVEEVAGEAGVSLVEVHDASGRAVTPPMRPDEALLPVLQRLHRAAIVRGLQSGHGEQALVASFEIRWRRASDTAPTCVRYAGSGDIEGMAEGPATVSEHDRIYCEIVNVAQPRKANPIILYVTILDVDMDGRIWLRTRSESSGPAIHAQGAYVLGLRAHGGLTPLPMRWPAEVPRTGQGLRSLVIIVADRPHDLRALETCDLDVHATTHGLALPEMAGVLRAGAAPPPAAHDMKSSDMRYAVVRLDFEVVPEP